MVILFTVFTTVDIIIGNSSHSLRFYHCFMCVCHMLLNTMTMTLLCEMLYFYRPMHFSAKRGIAIACRLSVCLSVCL